MKSILSICCVTYNHEKYIAQCLDGFVMQKTNFDFEILVHEDASTDKTAKILRDYELKYPNLFRCVYQTENQFYKQNVLTDILFPMAKGKYIALCEGDDYWTDPLKLQKQVDFLEKNKEFVISCHNSNIVNFDGSLNRIFNEKGSPEITDTNYILRSSWYIPTASIVFKNENLELPKWFYKGLNGDYMLQLILTSKGGLVHYEKEIMSSYRLHNVGLSNIFKKKNVFNYSMLYINKEFNKFSQGLYYEAIRENIADYTFSILYSTPILSNEFWRVTINLIWFNRGLSKKHCKILLKRIIPKRIVELKSLFLKLKSSD